VLVCSLSLLSNMSRIVSTFLVVVVNHVTLTMVYQWPLNHLQVSGSAFSVSGFEFRVLRFGFLSFVFWVSGSEFRVLCFTWLLLVLFLISKFPLSTINYPL
jgi:hypothetical protein